MVLADPGKEHFDLHTCPQLLALMRLLGEVDVVHYGSKTH
jgi:hypothetical protein